MKSKLDLYYDEEGDFLEIAVGSSRNGYFQNLGNGVFKRVDKKTKEITGIAIHGFRKRTAGLKQLKVSLPIRVQLLA